MRKRKESRSLVGSQLIEFISWLCLSTNIEQRQQTHTIHTWFYGRELDSLVQELMASTTSTSNVSTVLETTNYRGSSNSSRWKLLSQKIHETLSSMDVNITATDCRLASPARALYLPTNSRASAPSFQFSFLPFYFPFLFGPTFAGIFFWGCCVGVCMCLQALSSPFSLPVSLQVETGKSMVVLRSWPNWKMAEELQTTSRRGSFSKCWLFSKLG